MACGYYKGAQRCQWRQTGKRRKTARVRFRHCRRRHGPVPPQFRKRVPGLDHPFARMAVDIRSRYARINEFGRQHPMVAVDAGRPTGQDGMVVRHVVIDNAVAVTDRALELAGNRGLRRDFDLERHHRDAITARSHAPQSHMIRTILGQTAAATAQQSR
ncbi:acyl-CoA dehydrogenase family protein [Sinorhizobium meliloti]|uniref:acyl-CoA dehydrogenase family protein n=1 Tax=Rhizobium meliloti TaxID=382 RepID=UPI002E15D25D